MAYKKAEYYIDRALRLLLVQPSEQPIQASEAQDSIETLNDMMFEFEDTGLPLGYTEVSNLGDDVTVPDYSRRMVVYNLAKNLSIEYDVPLKPEHEQIAYNSLAAVERVVIRAPQAIYPDTLPTGAGNDNCGRWADRFYPGEEENNIVTEQTGSILQEEGTENDE